MPETTFHKTFSTSQFWLSRAKNGSESGLWSAVSYRFGFNGKENDNEVKGTGNSVDFGARIYDPRLGRWLSVDPLQIKYPGLSTYQFSANTPISAIDPDGRVIIFINGLWGSPTGAEGGGTAEYWGNWWVEDVQNAIGDHKPPRYYDGSMGGTSAFGINTSMSNRILIGKATGYRDAKTIIDNLSAGETIKIVTNSMGTAFERGFTDGLYQYIDERMTQISSELGSLTMQKNILEQGLDKGRLNALNLLAEPTAAEKQLMDINSKMSALEAEKKKLENVEVEMVVDLSSHQVDFPDNNATSNYYMVAAPNTKHWAEQLFVNEKEIGGGSQPLGFMRGHAGWLADPSSFPSAKKRDD